MRRRPSRDISIFSMSMLDVICSALGAILILFILSETSAGEARADAQRSARQLEALQRDLMAAQEAEKKARQAEEAAARRAEAAELKARRPGGLAVGMCQTTAERVVARVFDHGSPDGDRVDFSLNNEPFRQNVTLPGPSDAVELTVELDDGPNYLGARALNEGTSSPNTATVVIQPCRNGQPEVFKWDMKRGEERHISIVRL